MRWVLVTSFNVLNMPYTTHAKTKGVGRVSIGVRVILVDLFFVGVVHLSTGNVGTS